MQRLQKARNELNIATVQLVALNARLNRILGDDATISSVTSDVEAMADIVNKLVKSIDDAAKDIADGVPPLLVELMRRGHYE